MKTPIKDNTEVSISIEEHKALQNEYDQFVYMVSHDLNSPFRHIKGFTEILVKNMDEETANANATFTRAIQNSVTKCQAMLDALLQFSRIKKPSEPAEPYDLNNALNSAQKRMSSNPIHTNAMIEAAPLPTITGYWIFLNELFHQIISNAVKFQPNDATAHIKIEHEETSDKHIIKFIDNGIGIDEKHHEDVFTMFRTINHEDDYEGFGAGLAHCKKIMQIHDGTITISNTPSGETCVTLIFKK